MCKMTERLARHTVKNYRCSRCYGLLCLKLATNPDGQLEKSSEGEQLIEVKCRATNEDFGFVSNSFVEKERSRDFDWAYEVKRDLSRMGIVPKEKING